MCQQVGVIFLYSKLNFIIQAEQPKSKSFCTLSFSLFPRYVADVFNNFKNKEGRFKSELGTDIKGLMALYEASHLSIKGEDILDQAADYSCLLLDGWMMNLDQRQARLVDSTLRHPYHKNLARFTARSFVSDYKGINGWVDGLQELATMDFKMVQSTNQREILQFSE